MAGIIGFTEVGAKLLSSVIDYIHEKKSSIKPKFGVYEYPKYEGMEFWGDNTKLKNLGWRLKFDIENAIYQTISKLYSIK